MAIGCVETIRVDSIVSRLIGHEVRIGTDACVLHYRLCKADSLWKMQRSQPRTISLHGGIRLLIRKTLVEKGVGVGWIGLDLVWSVGRVMGLSGKVRVGCGDIWCMG
jgi:hypothetical protein